MKRRTRALLLGVAALVAVDQLTQHSLLASGYLLGRRMAPFDPPLFAPHQVDRITSYRRLAASGLDPRRESDFDPELGWSPRPGTVEGLYRIDERGARIGAEPVPRARTSGVKRVVALGCSFTFGQEVLGTAAWVARVDAARPDLEVVNLAYGSYGLDQALLRLRRDGLREQPDEVWLGILPGALLRNVTVWAPALRHWTDVQHLKPRFELDERGELVLRPNPARSLEELVAIVTDQQRFLAAAGGRDAWVRRFPAAYAPRGSSPWHHSAAARLALTLLERTGRDAAPYVRDSRSEVHRLGLALAREIDREARAIGARLLVLILPGRTDVEARADSGESYWQALVDGLRSAGIEVLDLCPAFEAARAHEDDGCWAPGSHYSVKGNQIAAEAFLAHLAERP